MTLLARAIAVQGFSFTPIAMAVQGLVALYAEQAKTWDTSQGRAGTNPVEAPDMRGYLERLEREAKAELARQQQAEEAIIMSIVQFVLEEATCQ